MVSIYPSKVIADPAGFDDTSEISKNDLGKIRFMDFGQIKVKFTNMGNPWGLWQISYSRGEVPAELSGQYTSFEKAEEATRSYATKVKRPAGETYRPDLKTAQEAALDLRD